MHLLRVPADPDRNPGTKIASVTAVAADPSPVTANTQRAGITPNLAARLTLAVNPATFMRKTDRVVGNGDKRLP